MTPRAASPVFTSYGRDNRLHTSHSDSSPRMFMETRLRWSRSSVQAVLSSPCLIYVANSRSWLSSS